MNSGSLRLRGVSKTYYERTYAVEALNDINMDIEEGDFFVLLGPSGCGKTTMLKLVSGLLPPDDGEVWLDDRLVFSSEKGINVKPAEREVSFVFQNMALYPHMTVKGNLEFPLKMKKIPKEQRQRTIETVISYLQIGPLLRRFPRQLSGGQLQRVALGRALVRDPKIFLMDEPMSNMDAELRRGIRGYFRNLQRKIRTTTIYVTHDQREAMALADKLAVVIDGEVQQLGTPREVYEQPANLEVAGFMGETPINLFQGELISEDNLFYFRTDYARFQMDQQLAWKLRNTGRKECTLGIRPEFIQLAPPGKGTVDARINFTQNTGPTKVLYAYLGDQKPVMIEMRSDTYSDVREDKVGLSFEPEKLNVFSTAGNRLSL